MERYGGNCGGQCELSKSKALGTWVIAAVNVITLKRDLRVSVEPIAWGLAP
jgi:hypothetical protein